MNDDRYIEMLRLAESFGNAAEELRHRARLGQEILTDPDVSDSAPLSPRTFEAVERDVRAATTGGHGLLSRSLELDADALVVRATVHTYQWIDALTAAAQASFGTIAGRALGYLAPEVELGGAIVSAGLIETDALDRDHVAAYLGELAESHPELMDHVTSGGGGLIDALQMRSLLTSPVLAGPDSAAAARGGRRAIGISDVETSAAAALRDVAGLESAGPEAAVDAGSGAAPATLADLLAAVEQNAEPVLVSRVGDDRWIAYLSEASAPSARLRLVGAGPEVGRTVAAIAEITGPGARVMLVGGGRAGALAAEVAAAATPFTVDQVVTAGAPAAHVPRLPASVRMLSLEDDADPVALLGSLINHGSDNRVTVIYSSDDTGWAAGGRAADAADHPALRAEIQRIRELGYLAG
ncbi:hypothetical protein [Nocardioides limicola]|uniref:hypothetical protein n=1 Tax=Nocardioides limicola TaxID=2803368 RepID=UPI00193B264A|nr:hypothetical protein [Nocardioides sp. DJM-14]